MVVDRKTRFKRRLVRKVKKPVRRVVRRQRHAFKPKRVFGYTGLVNAAKLRSFPDHMMVKLPYYSGNFGSTTTTTLGQRLVYWTAGQPFGVSHEARGFNQWSTLYTRYRVVGCKFILRAANLTANTVSQVGYVVSDSQQTTLADLTDAMENHRVTRRPLQEGSGVVTLKRFVRPWDIEGIRRDQWFDSNLYAGSTSTSVGGYSNPTSLPTLEVFWQSMDETTTIGHNITLELIQYIIFDVPRDMPLSN